MRQLLKNLTKNDDGTPLPGIPYIGVVMLGAAMGWLIYAGLF